MAIFKYTYLTKDGKKSSGVISCDSEPEAIKNINGQIISVKKVHHIFYRVKNSDLVQFFTYILFQVKNKVSIFEAISSYIEIVENITMQAILANICQKMLQGCTLFEAILSDGVFGDVIPSLIQSAEMSGNLEEALNSIIIYLKFKDKIRLKIRKAALYPAIVLCLSILAFFFCLSCLGPQVQDILNSGVESIWITDICLFLIPNDINMLIFIVLIMCTTLFAVSQKKLIKLACIVPLSRKVILKFYEWNCCTIMYISIISQINLIQTINLMISSMKNTHFSDEFDRFLVDIMNGAKLSQILSNSVVFSKQSVNLVKIGEENNELSATFKNIVEMQNEEIIFMINRLGIIISSIITIITGVLLTFILLGLYYPLYSSIEVIEM